MGSSLACESESENRHGGSRYHDGRDNESGIKRVRVGPNTADAQTVESSPRERPQRPRVKVGDKMGLLSYSVMVYRYTHGRRRSGLPHLDGCHDILRRRHVVAVRIPLRAGNRLGPGYVLQVKLPFGRLACSGHGYDVHFTGADHDSSNKGSTHWISRLRRPLIDIRPNRGIQQESSQAPSFSPTSIERERSQAAQSHYLGCILRVDPGPRVSTCVTGPGFIVPNKRRLDFSLVLPPWAA